MRTYKNNREPTNVFAKGIIMRKALASLILIIFTCVANADFPHTYIDQHPLKTVTANNIENLSKLKDSHKIPKNYRACHTAVIGQYIVEGHVPANIIKQLVNEQPLVKGITVPGMPVGAPGMESSDPDANQSYEVFSFSNDGEIKVYADIN